MKKLIAALVTAADALSPYFICIIVLIDAILHISAIGPAMTAFRMLILAASLFAINFCIAQVISLRWPRTFNLADILNSNHLIIEYQDLLDDDDEETDCVELDIIQDDDYFDEPRLCCCLLYDKHLQRVQMLCCPVYTSETEREIRTFSAMKGVHRFYRLDGMDDLEGYEDMSIDEDMLKIIIRVIMSIEQKDSIESARKAYRFILDTSEGILPTFAFGRKGRFNPSLIGPEPDDFK